MSNALSFLRLRIKKDMCSIDVVVVRGLFCEQNWLITIAQIFLQPW